MKWVLYVKDDEDCNNLLHILQREPRDKLRSTLKKIEYVRFGLTKTPYLESKKKTVSGLKDVLPILTLPRKSSKPNQSTTSQTIQPRGNAPDYDSMMYDTIFDGTQDDPDDGEKFASRERELMTQKAADIQSKRESIRPPKRVSKDDAPAEKNYAEDSADAEDGIDAYFDKMIRDGGRE